MYLGLDSLLCGITLVSFFFWEGGGTERGGEESETEPERGRQREQVKARDLLWLSGAGHLSVLRHHLLTGRDDWRAPGT